MKKILQNLLKFLAKKCIKRYKPFVIGITGTAGKTTTKEAIFSVVSKKFTARKNILNFNNEIGVPMAVLGLESQSKPGWIKNILKSLWVCFGLKQKNYPAVLVLELAADKPGDIKYLVDMVKPSVGVVTAIGEIPVHVEFYASPDAVAREKAILINSLPSSGGLAVLNYDDLTVLEMKEKTGAKIMTFGFSDKADVYASDISYFSQERDEILGGISFKLHYGSSFVPVRLGNLVGRPLIYSFLAAAAVGIDFGANLVEISECFSGFTAPKSRMTLMKGIKNSIIIDDTYNASPIAMHMALEALRDFADVKLLAASGHEIGPKGHSRKIAVLGDMKELGKYTIAAHESIGNMAGNTVDVLITVGSAAKFIAQAAKNQMPQEQIFEFNTAEEAKTRVQEILREGDVILVKGSRAMGMEKIVDEIKMTPGSE